MFKRTLIHMNCLMSPVAYSFDIHTIFITLGIGTNMPEQTVKMLASVAQLDAHPTRD